MSLIKEIARRNVAKVAILYIVVAWVVLQAADVLSSLLSLPSWTGYLVIMLLVLGFVPALIFSWVYEITPEGIKRENEVDRSTSVTHETGRKLNVVIAALLVVLIASFWFEHLLLQDPVITGTSHSEEIINSQIADNTIAVLPFVNTSSDAENEYFSDGLSEELINLLTRIPQLRVAARTSSFSFKGRDKTVREIAEVLNVSHVLEGSVRKSGDKIRITTQLIAAESGFQLWSATYEREVENIFQTQQEIAASVSDALKIAILDDVPLPARMDAEAYDLYLRCQYLSHRGDLESYERAIELCRSALAIDDSYAPAWSELAASYWWYTAFTGMPISIGVNLASESVERALEIDRSNARAYFIRGMLRTASYFRFSEGFADFARAAELEPGNARYMFGTSAIHFQSGQLDMAIKRLEEAIELDPLSPQFYRFLGLFYQSKGQYEEAVSAIQTSLELNPSTAGAHYTLARIFIDQGRLAEARRELELEPLEIYRLNALAMLQYAADDASEASTTLRRLIEIGAEDAAFQIAEVYAAMGDVDRSFEWLETARRNRDSGVTNIVALANDFQLLHADPRWVDLLERMDLLEAWREMPPEWGGPESPIIR